MMETAWSSPAVVHTAGSAPTTSPSTPASSWALRPRLVLACGTCKSAGTPTSSSARCRVGCGSTTRICFPSSHARSGSSSNWGGCGMGMCTESTTSEPTSSQTRRWIASPAGTGTDQTGSSSSSGSSNSSISSTNNSTSIGNYPFPAALTGRRAWNRSACATSWTSVDGSASFTTLSGNGGQVTPHANGGGLGPGEVEEQMQVSEQE